MNLFSELTLSLTTIIDINTNQQFRKQQIWLAENWYHQCANVRILLVKRIYLVSGIFATSFRVWQCNVLKNKKPISHLQKVLVCSQRDLWSLNIKWSVDNGAFVDRWTFLKTCRWDLSESLPGMNLCEGEKKNASVSQFCLCKKISIWINRFLQIHTASHRPVFLSWGQTFLLLSTVFYRQLLTRTNG